MAFPKVDKRLCVPTDPIQSTLGMADKGGFPFRTNVSSEPERGGCGRMARPSGPVSVQPAKLAQLEVEIDAATMLTTPVKPTP